MVSAKFLLFSVTTLVLGASLLSYLAGTNGEFYFEAVDNETGDNMYFQFTGGNTIKYDLLTEIPQGEDNAINAAYKLTRLEQVDGDYRMVSALLDVGMAVIDLSTINEEVTAWSTVDVADAEDLNNFSVTELSASLYSLTGPDGDTIEVGLDADGNPISFAGMTILSFNPSASGYDSSPCADIVTGEVGQPDTFPVTDDDVRRLAEADENKHQLRRQLAGFSDSCPLDNTHSIAKSAYYQTTSGQNAVAATCNGKTVTAFEGTSTGLDIWNDLRGVFDNFRGGWNSIRNTEQRDTPVDICTGHSLGGAIAKYNAIQGKCGEVVTFGAPFTTNFPSHIPITQYVHILDYNGWTSCCARKWWGGCKHSNMYVRDIVTRVGTFGGSHTNVRYTRAGGHFYHFKRPMCWAGFGNSLISGGFGLHSMATYLN